MLMESHIVINIYSALTERTMYLDKVVIFNFIILNLSDLPATKHPKIRVFST